MDYKKVIEDFANGTIDRDKWIVVFDNDCGYWSYRGDDLEGDEHEEARVALQGEMAKKYGEPDGYGDVQDVAEAAGIPSEWC